MHILRAAGSSTIELVEASNPVPGPGEVLIETAVSAVCGSEMHTYRGEGSTNGNSGHEAVGTVVALGEGVTNLKKGQRVGASAIMGCGTCPLCVKGQYTWCSNFRFYGSMHAQAFVAAADACCRLPDDVSWEAGVLLTGDGFGVPYHTSKKINAEDIDVIAVFGAGPIGLGNIIMQHYLGRKTIAVDISQDRLELAAKLGADETVCATDTDSVAAVRSLTGGSGADVCIEAAGVPETAIACFEAVRTAGTVVFNGEQGEMPISPSDHFIRRDLTAVGSWFYHFCEIDEMIDLYRKKLPVTSLISHRFPYTQAADGYAAFAAGKTAKVILDWTTAG